MRNGTRGRRLRSERAATLVEYALGVSLVVVVSLSSLQFLQDEGSEALSDQQSSAGAPDVNAVSATGGTAGGTTTSGTTTSGTTTGGSTTIEPEASLTATTSGKTNDWSASVVITVTDPNNGGAPVPGAIVEGVWSVSGNGETSCTTDQNGQCAVTQGKMCRSNSQNNCTPPVGSVSFSVSTVTGSDLSYTQSPPPTITVTAPA